MCFLRNKLLFKNVVSRVYVSLVSSSKETEYESTFFIRDQNTILGK